MPLKNFSEDEIFLVNVERKQLPFKKHFQYEYKTDNIEKIKEKLPEGERYFDEDAYTDKSIKFMVSEIIREKMLWKLNDEIPHGTAVSIEEFKDEYGFSEAEYTNALKNENSDKIAKDAINIISKKAFSVINVRI